MSEAEVSADVSFISCYVELKNQCSKVDLSITTASPAPFFSFITALLIIIVIIKSSPKSSTHN